MPDYSNDDPEFEEMKMALRNLYDNKIQRRLTVGGDGTESSDDPAYRFGEEDAKSPEDGLKKRFSRRKDRTQKSVRGTIREDFIGEQGRERFFVCSIIDSPTCSFSIYFK